MTRDRRSGRRANAAPSGAGRPVPRTSIRRASACLRPMPPVHASRSHASLAGDHQDVPWPRTCARRRNPTRASWASSCRIPWRSMDASTARVRRRRASIVLRSRPTRGASGGDEAGHGVMRQGAVAAVATDWRDRRVLDERRRCGRRHRLVPGFIRMALALHGLDVAGHMSPEALLLGAEGRGASSWDGIPQAPASPRNRRPPARGTVQLGIRLPCRASGA